MTSPIVNPEIPYNGTIEGGLQPGLLCRIQGVTHPNADRFNINLQTGPNAKPRDDTALHVSVRLNQGYVARNIYKDGSWGDEEGNGRLPIGPAQSFEILILTDPNNYKIGINGQHFCEFNHKVPFKDVSHLLIDGDVSITLISWEAATVPVQGDVAAARAAQLNAEGPNQPPPQAPQGGYGPPQGGYGPPQGGYGPPQGGYGPQGPYGPPPPGYGPPPPPGAEPESGFNSFLEQAQSVLAGAIKSGAAEKLLGGLLSTGGQQPQHQQQGYAPQNARYGIYPDLPRDELSQPPQDQNPQNRGPGPVESFLTNFLSGGGNNQQQSQQQYPNVPPQTQQNPPQSQGSNLGNILADLISPRSNTQGGNQNYNPNQPQQPAPPPQPAPPQQPPQYNQSNQNTDVNDVSDLLANLIAGKGNNPQQNPQNVQGPQGDPQQQQYGQYPLPPQQHQPPQEQRGPIENLLSGLLSSGGNTRPTNQPQQPHIPQVGGEGSVGGLGSMGGILSNLAGQILHNPRDGNQRQNY